MIKKLILIVVVLIVLVIGGLIAVVTRIDSIARRGIEIAGTRATGVQTTLEDIKISLFGGEVELGGLELSNPSGYDAPHFMKLDEGDVAVTLGTLMQEQIVVPRLHLDGIDVHLEKKAGKANYEVILENMQTAEETTPPPDQAPGKKYVIEEILITNVTVHAAMMPVGVAIGDKLTQVDVLIPEIRLENVGSDSDNGVLLKEVSGTIIKAVLVAVARKGAGILPESIIGGLEGGLAGLEGLGGLGLEVTGQAVEIATQSVEEIGKIGGETVQGVGEAGKEAVEGAGEALKGIFQKK